jgi:hypothetical protein
MVWRISEGRVDRWSAGLKELSCEVSAMLGDFNV